MKWTQVDKNWWQANDGSYVRQVTMKEWNWAIKYVCWKPLGPVYYYFTSSQQARQKIESLTTSV